MSKIQSSTAASKSGSADDFRNASGQPPTPDQDIYDAYCQQVDREDKLVHNRLQWLLTMEGFLIGALALMAKPGPQADTDIKVVEALKQCIPIIGIVIPVSALIVNLFSHIVVARLLKKWNTIAQYFPNHPSPFGGQTSSVPELGPAVIVPLCIIVAWGWIIYRIWPL